MATTADTIRRRRDDVIARFGPWTAFNVDLGHGVFTIAPGTYGMVEQRIERIVQLVSDFSARPLAELRVLDLGAYEGGFAIELARRGATVVAVEGRAPHVEKMRFAADVLELERFEARHADVRRLDAAELGAFDVALCLGVLYHLDAPDVPALLGTLAEISSGFAIVETQVGLTGRARLVDAGREYRGLLHREDLRQPGASLDNVTSFWPTRASLLNMLADAGFTSVAQCAVPVIPALDAYRDHVTLLAVPGRAAGRFAGRWPERLPALAHPSQGPRHRALDRVRRVTGGGLAAVFDRRRGRATA